MRVRPAGAVLLAMGCFFGCAVGTSSTTGDGGTPKDGGAKDTGTATDSGTPKDSGSQGNDSGTTQLDSGGGCGTCLGNANTCCGSTCVDVTNDPNNCGTCGNGCTGMTCCSSSCVDKMTDNYNCGTCGNACGSGQTCTGGTCQGGTSTCTIDMGSCSHSPCATGVKLTIGCDANVEDIVSFVCLFLDPTCCTSSWTSSCVSDAALLETNSCIGGGC